MLSWDGRRHHGKPRSRGGRSGTCRLQHRLLGIPPSTDRLKAPAPTFVQVTKPPYPRLRPRASTSTPPAGPERCRYRRSGGTSRDYRRPRRRRRAMKPYYHRLPLLPTGAVECLLSRDVGRRQPFRRSGGSAATCRRPAIPSATFRREDRPGLGHGSEPRWRLACGSSPAASAIWP